MALDPSDLLEPPYGLGECVEQEFVATVRCEAWEVPVHEVNIFARKRGDMVKVIVPELIYKSNQTGVKDLIQFSSFYNSDTWLGLNPESMRFTAFGLNGCERNSDELTNEVCSCTVDLDYMGNFYIAPDNDDEGFLTSADGDQVGCFSFSFTYFPNNDETESQPEEKIARLGV